MLGKTKLLSLFLCVILVFSAFAMTSCDETKGKEKNDVLVESYEIDENGNLILTYSDGSVQDMGQMTGTEVTLSAIEKSGKNALLLTLDNGLILKTEKAAALSEYKNGLGINSKGVLVSYSSKGKETKLGKIESVEISYTQEITLTLEDGTVLSLGSIASIEGMSCAHKWIEDSEMLDTEENTLYTVYHCKKCNEIKLEAVVVEDTDGDGLSDEDERNIHNTDPNAYDTDGDGASDGSEVASGFDPLSPDTSFHVTSVPVVDNGETPDTVKPSLQIELSGEQLNTLVVERDDFVDNSSLGYMGDAYNYEVEGSFDSATVGFEFDDTNLGTDALPTIYACDKNKGTMTPLDTKIEGNVATTEVSEFATYVLLDRKVYEESLTWIDVWGVEEPSYQNVEIVFVIDDSGSMTSNDSSNVRLSVAADLIFQRLQVIGAGLEKSVLVHNDNAHFVAYIINRTIHHMMGATVGVGTHFLYLTDTVAV